MIVDVKVNSVCQIDVDEMQALEILCKTLHMSFVFEDREFFVRKNSDGVNSVYIIDNGHDELYDDRGDLFIALRNVAVNIIPNLEFRSAEYIYH